MFCLSTRLRLLGQSGLLMLALGPLGQAGAQTPATAPAAEPVLAADLREEIQHIPVTVSDLYGRQETRQIPITVFRPAGAGPHPLVILNHGRPTRDKRAQQGRQRYEHMARYLVAKGFAVMLPTRLGYWETYGDFDPEDSGGCNAMRIEPMAKAAEARVPMLWLYWANDLYWGEDNPRRWQQAWTAGGAQVEFHTLPASGKDGHNGMNADMDHWVPLVEAYLARLGFTRPGVPTVPPTQAQRRVDALNEVPISESAREGLYRKFLAAPVPRAFAIGPSGHVGWATGDWAVGRALGFCQARKGQACKLYAVDDQVVWAP